MRALVVNDRHELSLVQFPEIDSLGPHDVRVRTGSVGVCATDREIVKTGAIFRIPSGDSHLVLGHEGSGVVSEVGGAVTSLHVGDVVVPVVAPDHNRGIDSHGFFCDSFVETEDRLLKLPAHLGELAVLIEPITIPHHALRQANMVRSAKTGVDWMTDPRTVPQNVLIVGVGPIGLFGAMVCRSWGYDTTVVDLLPDDNPRVDVVRRAGCQYVNVAEATSVVRPSAADRFDIILHAAPPPDPIVRNIARLAPRGVMSLVGWQGGRHDVTFDMASFVRDFVHDEQALVGTLGARTEDFKAAVDVLDYVVKQPSLAASAFISDVRSPEDFQQAFQARPDDIVVALDFRLTRG